MTARLFAYLSYADATAGLAWLEALGSEVVRRQDGGGGSILHSELRLDQVVVMVASNDEDYQNGPLLGRSTATACICSSMTSTTCTAALSTRAGDRSSLPRTPNGEPAGPASSTRAAWSGASGPMSRAPPGSAPPRSSLTAHSSVPQVRPGGPAGRGDGVRS